MQLPFQHLISASQLTKDAVDELFRVADFMSEVWSSGHRSDLLHEKVVALLFYEPSSRTMLSFQAAVQGLSAGMVLAQGKEGSSLEKGETIEDTIKVVARYADLVVMRHAEAGSAQKAANVSHVPFINAGDGGNEHPTQSLLDLYTIKKERGTIDGLHIALAGDLKHGRTVHSLCKVLRNYDVKLTFVAPDALAMPADIKKLLDESKIEYSETPKLEDGCNADVLYMTRIQKERFANPSEYDSLKDSYVLTAKHLKNKKVTVLHPLPRVNEISTDVDDLPNAAYFQQVRNGVPVRMALMSKMLGMM